MSIKKLCLFLPQLVFTLILIVGVGSALVQSLGYIPAYGLETFTLDYYKEAFSNPMILDSIMFSFWTALTSAIISLILALVINYILITLRTYNILIQVPIIIPHVMVALFMLQLFGQSGLFVRIALAFGYEGSLTFFNRFLHDPLGLGIIFGYLWKEIPFVVFYTYAILSSIDTKLGEAARVLGANSVQSFFKVTVPLAKSTIVSAFLIIFTFAFGAYELPQLLGPTLPRALPVQAYVEYTHPDLLNRPYAMAINGIIIVINIIIAAFYFYLVMKSDKERV